MILLDGKAFADKIHQNLKSQVRDFIDRTGVTPGLTTIRVGDNEASKVYVNRKAKMSKEAGMVSQKIELPESTNQQTLLREIRRLNQDAKVHGILVQLPLPKQISTEVVLDEVAVEKDVDGFHVVNAGRLASGMPGLVPCTPLGVMRLLEEYQIPIEGSHAVVVGRSNIVGKPMAQLLLKKNATVTICHSKTRDLPEVCRSADILVAAIGRSEFVRGDWVRPGAAVIDVGINRTSEGKLVGDVAFDEVKEKAGWLTPVPGGVGPLTIAMLLANTLTAAERIEASK